MDRVVFIIIDMQNAYFNNDALAKARNTLIMHINQLCDAAADRGVAVFNVVTEHARNGSTWTLNMLDDKSGYLLEGDEETHILDGLHIEGAETIVKTRDSAFYKTDLAKTLHERGIDTLILAGVSTHSCVFQTAADAYAENFKVVLARDAIASHDPSYHESTLRLLEQEYRQPSKSTQDILAILNQEGRIFSQQDFRNAG